MNVGHRTTQRSGTAQLFRLVACSGCGYSFWTTEDAEEWSPHCRYGRWMIDRDALNVPVGGYLESPNLSSKRRELYEDWV